MIRLQLTSVDGDEIQTYHQQLISRFVYTPRICNMDTHNLISHAKTSSSFDMSHHFNMIIHNVAYYAKTMSSISI